MSARTFRPRTMAAAMAGGALVAGLALAIAFPARDVPPPIAKYGGHPIAFDSLHRWHYADVARCVGRNPTPPVGLTLWQLPDSAYLARQGYAFLTRPPTIVLSGGLGSGYWPLVRHEFVHVLTRDASHDHPAFRLAARCDFIAE